MYNKNLIGKRMNWNDIKKEFPDRWVIIGNAETDRSGRIITGELLAFCKDVDLAKASKYVYDNVISNTDIYVLRTTMIDEGVFK